MECKNCGKDFEEHLKKCPGCNWIMDGNFMPASRGKRLVNFIVDTIFIIVTFTIIIVLVVLKRAAMLDLTGDELNRVMFQYMDFLILLPILYFMLMEFKFGKTLGKIVTKTVVVKYDGSEPKFMDIFMRTAGRLIPFEAFSYFSGPNPVGWHDLMSSTVVIDEVKSVKTRVHERT